MTRTPLGEISLYDMSSRTRPSLTLSANWIFSAAGVGCRAYVNFGARQVLGTVTGMPGSACLPPGTLDLAYAPLKFRGFVFCMSCHAESIITRIAV